MQRNCFRLLSLCLHTWLLLYAVYAYYSRDFPGQRGIVVDVTLSMAVMVLFRDRFRLVAPIYRNRPFTFVQRHFGDVHPKCAYGTCTSPRSGTKFAHALIKYRLSQMSLHRIHHPTQKAVHDPRKAPLSSPRPKPTRALWLVFQLFTQFTCFS